MNEFTFTYKNSVVTIQSSIYFIVVSVNKLPRFRYLCAHCF